MENQEIGRKGFGETEHSKIKCSSFSVRSKIIINRKIATSVII
jgi:hypothetical protein